MASPLRIKMTAIEWFNMYKRWISKNPNLLSDIESTLKYVSFFAAGKFSKVPFCFLKSLLHSIQLSGRLNSSTLTSELVYSLPNLMVLFNDQIIRASRNQETKLPSLQSKIKIWLTIIDYTEALFEVSAKKVWGEGGRWFVIALIQLLK